MGWVTRLPSDDVGLEIGPVVVFGLGGLTFAWASTSELTTRA